MSIIGRVFMTNDGKELDLNDVTTRSDLLKKMELEVDDTKHEVITDIKNIMISEDAFDEDSVKYIPLIKKYLVKLDNFMKLSFKASEIEIKKTEELEDEIKGLHKELAAVSKDMDTLAKNAAKQNEILERIAKALEKKDK